VLGPGYDGARPDGDVLADPRLWPRALAGAELLVTGFGHTLLEAAHLGVPALAVVASEQDARDAAAFATHGTAGCAGVDGAVAAALELLGAPARLAEMARRGPALVDGLGAERVARALVSLR
jgi:spore coat polysaccharide biosynthesis predicted glycosyltransferase SpsG